ncbi:MAG: hypothetical protein GWO04_46580, partial [Actinobacteria bacterium]|nr:hypothetical protein [Actinomycetota bacterium]NIV59196.1 hypothetical protein [Actinomycetota bacterium]NIV90813.1 hypothetical protein [Actinomycetota bacterium]
RDVIYAAAFLDRVGWYRNVNGDGSFWQSRIASDAVSLIAAVTAADIDMDGDLDLATAGSGDDTLRWHENLDGLGMQWSDHVVDAGLP